MRICPSCAGENADDAMFCGFCGTKMQTGPKKTLFGVAAIPTEDLMRAAKAARDKTEQSKDEVKAAATTEPKAAAPTPTPEPTPAAATPEPVAAAPEPAAAAPEPVAATEPEPEPDAAITQPDATDDAKSDDGGRTKRKSLADSLALSFGKPKKQSKPLLTPSTGIPRVEVDTEPVVPDLEAQPKADITVDDEAGVTLVDDEVGPTMQMDAVPSLPKAALVVAPATDVDDRSTVPSSAPAIKAVREPEIDTLEDNEPPGADGTVAPRSNIKVAGEAALKSGAMAKTPEPSVQVRESAIAEAAVKIADQAKPPSTPQSAQTNKAKPQDSSTAYPSPVKPGSKEDEEAFFGSSLSQYGMAPAQRAVPPQAQKGGPDTELRPAGGTNWGTLIFGFLVAALIIGAIAFLMFTGGK